MKAFFAAYGERLSHGGAVPRVLEIGSKSYQAHDTYRPLADANGFDYTGLDLEAGPNVDIVPAKTYVWDEIPDDSFDACISGQTFEHNPYFWVTACEIARVLVPGGYTCIIAPGAGAVHRYPVDCYRFYPDSWSAIAHLAGLELVETYFETDHASRNISGGRWRDSLMIARKPMQPNPAAAERRIQVLAPFRDGFGQFQTQAHKVGPAVERYLGGITSKRLRSWRATAAAKVAPFGSAKVYNGE